jgi:hypothetical protein
MEYSMSMSEIVLPDIISGLAMWAEIMVLWGVGFVCGLFAGAYLVTVEGGER